MFLTAKKLRSPSLWCFNTALASFRSNTKDPDKKANGVTSTKFCHFDASCPTLEFVGQVVTISTFRLLSKLAAKTTLGSANLILLLAIALFAPAWTLRFWQAWLYLFLFASSSAAITIYLWKRDPALLSRRVSAGPIAEKTRAQQIIQLFASIGFLAILVVPSLDRRFSWSHVPLWIVLAGDLLVVLGFYIVFKVFCVNTFTSATVEVTEQQTVISIGPYAFVRHPMYSGALVMLVGTPLALASWWGLVALVVMVAVIVVRLLDEEKLLLANLPGYTEYVARVKYRLMPSVW
jgi:protein-S-isoprenylcysteine O-methyltransferase Ste14